MVVKISVQKFNGIPCVMVFPIQFAHFVQFDGQFISVPTVIDASTGERVEFVLDETPTGKRHHPGPSLDD